MMPGAHSSVENLIFGLPDRLRELHRQVARQYKPECFRSDNSFIHREPRPCRCRRPEAVA